MITSIGKLSNIIREQTEDIFDISLFEFLDSEEDNKEVTVKID